MSITTPQEINALKARIGSALPDGNHGQITPAQERAALTQIIDFFQEKFSALSAVAPEQSELPAEYKFRLYIVPSLAANAYGYSVTRAYNQQLDIYEPAASANYIEVKQGSAYNAQYAGKRLLFYSDQYFDYTHSAGYLTDIARLGFPAVYDDLFHPNSNLVDLTRLAFSQHMVSDFPYLLYVNNNAGNTASTYHINDAASADFQLITKYYNSVAAGKKVYAFVGDSFHAGDNSYFGNLSPKQYQDLYTGGVFNNDYPLLKQLETTGLLPRVEVLNLRSLVTPFEGSDAVLIPNLQVPDPTRGNQPVNKKTLDETKAQLRTEAASKFVGVNEQNQLLAPNGSVIVTGRPVLGSDTIKKTTDGAGNDVLSLAPEVEEIIATTEENANNALTEVRDKFLDKDTIAQVRAMSATEITLLQSGVYRGVRLSGYSTKGDTPFPANYFVSNTTEPDDNGSVLVVEDIKLATTEYLSIEHFGGRKNTTYDSFPAFKTMVAYYNRMNYNITLVGEYLFKADGTDTTIYVSADFSKAKLTMDCNGHKDFRINFRPRTSFHSATSITDNITRTTVLNAVEAAINTNNKVLTGIAASTLKNKYICLRTYDAHRVGRVESERLGGNAQTWWKEENFFVDVHGNIEGEFYNNDLDLVNPDGTFAYYIEGYEFSDKRYFIGGTVKYLQSNISPSPSIYRQIGFYFEGLCNIELSGITADIYPIQNSIFGFIRLLKCYNVSVDGLSATPANHNHSLTNNNSSYVLNITDCQNVDIYKYTCPDLLNSNQWGSTCGHRSTNVNFHNCVTNRIDCHYRGWNWSVNNTKIGNKGITYSGGGIWRIKDVEVHGAQYILSGRSDYASEFRGDIYVESSTLYTSFDSKNTVVDITVAADTTNSFAFHPGKVNEVIHAGCTNLYIKNVTFSNAVSGGARLNSFNSAVRVTQENLTQHIKLPNVYVDGVQIQNVSVTSSDNDNRFSAFYFDYYSAFMQVRQGANNVNVSAAASNVLPSFTEKYNLFVECRNVNFGRNTGINLIAFNTTGASNVAVFDASTNKGQAPLISFILHNCKNVVPVTHAYRAKIEAYNSEIFNAVTPFNGGMYSWNKVHAYNGVYKIGNTFNYPLVNNSVLEGDVILNGIQFDVTPDAPDNLIAGTLFRTTNYPSATFTPVVVLLDFIKPEIRNNHLSREIKARLQIISNNLVAAGNKGFLVSYVENILRTNRDGSIAEVSNIADLPVLWDFTRFGNLKALYYTGTEKEQLHWDNTNVRWVNQLGAKVGSRRSGTTAQRPAVADVPIGYTYTDTTTGYSVRSNGTIWKGDKIEWGVDFDLNTDTADCRFRGKIQIDFLSAVFTGYTLYKAGVAMTTRTTMADLNTDLATITNLSAENWIRLTITPSSTERKGGFVGGYYA
ncbi:hypothetical protein [Pontibacter sp. SGAir0037]|uniref:hypothetical protein n=1 Tax=Pontibacter sp. SGAir0037 TaxID=2571030 RepID=UPI0010CD3F6B|nr:hypothetical protein [Pontibacter sp. SGAir0037]QCR23089.1 hypothetical protein C1N53_12525 [Pontibacter sp. SGAir0037]